MPSVQKSCAIKVFTEFNRKSEPTKLTLSIQYVFYQLTGKIENLKIGILKEGFGLNISEPDVDEMVKKAAGQLSSKYGTVIEEVSIPMHSDGKWYVNNFTLEISLSYNNDYVQIQYTEKGTEEGKLPVMSFILWK